MSMTVPAGRAASGTVKTIGTPLLSKAAPGVASSLVAKASPEAICLSLRQKVVTPAKANKTKARIAMRGTRRHTQTARRAQWCPLTKVCAYLRGKTHRHENAKGTQHKVGNAHYFEHDARKGDAT